MSTHVGFKAVNGLSTVDKAQGTAFKAPRTAFRTLSTAFTQGQTPNNTQGKETLRDIREWATNCAVSIKPSAKERAALLRLPLLSHFLPSGGMVQDSRLRVQGVGARGNYAMIS